MSDPWSHFEGAPLRGLRVKSKRQSMNDDEVQTANTLPEPTSTYAGRLTDTSRWASFLVRPGDIFICTPPKCGTTWTQAICAHLIFGTMVIPGKLTNISPWFDSKLE